MVIMSCHRPLQVLTCVVILKPFRSRLEENLLCGPSRASKMVIRHFSDKQFLQYFKIHIFKPDPCRERLGLIEFLHFLARYPILVKFGSEFSRSENFVVQCAAVRTVLRKGNFNICDIYNPLT